MLRVASHLVPAADIDAASEVHLVQVLERPLLGLRQAPKLWRVLAASMFVIFHYRLVVILLCAIFVVFRQLWSGLAASLLVRYLFILVSQLLLPYATSAVLWLLFALQDKLRRV